MKLPTSTSKNAREQNRLKREALQLKREMNNTSSQDEFAKWAKLRRRHDKTMEEYEEMSTFGEIFYIYKTCPCENKDKVGLRNSDANIG